MIHKKQFTAFAKKIVRAQKGIQNHQLMHPNREWTIGLLIAFFLFAGSAVWSSLTYFEYESKDTTAETTETTQPVVYRESLVSAALEVFDQKQSTLNNLLDVSSVPNPVVVVATTTEPEAVESTASSTELQSTSTESASQEESELAEDPEVDDSEEATSESEVTAEESQTEEVTGPEDENVSPELAL